MKSYVEKVDFFVGNSPENLANEFGTPLYVYNEEILRESFRTVAGIVKKYPYRANYSIKANSNLTVLKIAHEEGVFCDAMSRGEIDILLKAGFSKDEIFFVPNNIDSEEMQYAIDLGIMTSLDSVDQLRTFGELNRGGKCAIRINPGVGAGHHEKVVTAGKNTKFGISEADIDEALDVAMKYDLRIVGINQHVGSLYMTPQPFLDAIDNFLRIAKKFNNLEFIDFGGGFGIPYHKLGDEAPFDMELLSAEWTKRLDIFVEEYGYAPLFKSEPGRYCVAESAVILGRVNAIKYNGEHKYAGTDVGMNVLARPVLYDSWHDIEICRNGKIVTDNPEKITVTGNICESGDCLCKDRLLPEIEDNDLIIVLDAGAYGYSMSYPYNLRMRPAEIMIMKDGTVKLIRRRETFEDIMRMFE